MTMSMTKPTYIWLKWIDYSPYFDGANIRGADVEDIDAQGRFLRKWGSNEVRTYDIVIHNANISIPHTYLVSYGDVYRLDDTNRGSLLQRVRHDSDALWFKAGNREYVFLPNPEGEYGYYLLQPSEVKTMKTYTKAFETVSDLICTIFDLEDEAYRTKTTVADVIEAPIRVGLDGDFYPATFDDATHLLRIDITEQGCPEFQPTHIVRWALSELGDGDEIGKAVSDDGWTVLITRKPIEEGEWMAFIPYTPEDAQEFSDRYVHGDPYISWSSRRAELKPYNS